MSDALIHILTPVPIKKHFGSSSGQSRDPKPKPFYEPEPLYEPKPRLIALDLDVRCDLSMKTEKM
ncbi:hypothetical protein ColTof4_10452 [Colletotrichum tofieldiae]|nr:hypothetical protein ColTof3_05893 [Colletotrichum tofieldiae]GKT78029.1 hypothetical protein ColTof4_10452 [Colletotrichum tofieldiae]GKT84650.1 hypothetical protein Ct61P_02500 [Colletotrichum tofieldiae]